MFHVNICACEQSKIRHYQMCRREAEDINGTLNIIIRNQNDNAMTKKKKK